MQVLFEEGGNFKTGEILSESEANMLIEASSGKRLKLKKTHALLRFASPAGASLLAEANEEAKRIDPAFLWECIADGEFSCLDLARDYSGHEPSPTEAAAMLFAVHHAPLYFHRNGKGKYRRAPADILQAALASQAKKERQAASIQRWSEELQSGRLPNEIADKIDQLLSRPDRNQPECKALEAACEASNSSPVEILYHCGAFESPYDLHYRRFLLEHFPKGAAFPETSLPDLPTGLPDAGVAAFSVDDATTTEIDDALSVTKKPDGGFRIGIHIAAPALGFDHQHPVAALARARLSTVYMPGDKITMLPDQVIKNFTLDGHSDCPALSLYLSVNTELIAVEYESRLENVHIAANLRHHEIEPLFNDRTISEGLPTFPFSDELLLLWRFANASQQRRGIKETHQNKRDFNFHIEGDMADPESCHVSIEQRLRGNPLDKVVSELMIIANSTWGSMLAENQVAGMFRSQVAGKTRMSTTPRPHEGLNVEQYAWCTSPLRRYADLLNQWQLIAILQDRPPPFSKNMPELFASLQDFESSYNAYGEFQRQIEYYWCLRWLIQESVSQASAKVLRDNLVQIEGLPLFLRVAALPSLHNESQEHKEQRRVLLELERPDLLSLQVNAHYLKELEAGAALYNNAGIGQADGDVNT